MKEMKQSKEKELKERNEMKESKEMKEMKQKKEYRFNENTQINQLIKLSEIIQKEKGIQFIFGMYQSKKMENEMFQLFHLLDRNRNQLSLIEFLEKYEKQKELNEIVMTKEIEFEWMFQDENAINQLLTNERKQMKKINKNNDNGLVKTKEYFSGIIIRKLNTAMMYFILKECNGYKFQCNLYRIRVGSFIHIETIKKNEVDVYVAKSSVNSKTSKLSFSSKNAFELYNKKEQLETLASIIKKEKGISFIFNHDIYSFELIKFLDENDNPLDLLDFTKKYDNFIELNILLLNSEKNNQHKIKLLNRKKKKTMFMEIHQSEWAYLYPNEIEEIIKKETNPNQSFTERNEIFMRKLNITMINYILKECSFYRFVIKKENDYLNEFMYIQKIYKRKRILYDSRKEIDSEKQKLGKEAIQKYLREKQIRILKNILFKEKGYRFVIVKERKQLQLKNYTLKKRKHTSLVVFFNEYCHLDYILKHVDIKIEGDMNDKQSQQVENTEKDEEDQYDLKDIDNYEYFNFNEIEENDDDEIKKEMKEEIEDEEDEIIEIDEDEEYEENLEDYQMIFNQDIKENKIENIFPDENKIEINALTILFNNTLISILNKLHYSITFMNINPDSTNENCFLMIKTIQKENEQCFLYDSEIIQINSTIYEKIIDRKYYQLQTMIDIVQENSTVRFLFTVNDLDDENKSENLNYMNNLNMIDKLNELQVEKNNVTITLNTFIVEFIDNNIIDHVINHFKLFQGETSYDLKSYIEMTENTILIKQIKLWKTNDERNIDEWNRIFIYLLILFGYSITFVKDSVEKYVELLQSIENNEIQDFSENSNENESFLFIESVSYGSQTQLFSQTKENQMYLLNWIVTNHLNSYIYMINHSNDQQNNITILPKSLPRYIQINSFDEMSRPIVLNSTQFLEHYQVNKAIKAYLNQYLIQVADMNDLNTFNNVNKMNQIFIYDSSNAIPYIDSKQVEEFIKLLPNEEEKRNYFNQVVDYIQQSMIYMQGQLQNDVNNLNNLNNNNFENNDNNNNNQTTFPTYYLQKRSLENEE